MNENKYFRILIVDDNQLARKGLSAFIKSFSHKRKSEIKIEIVGEAANGQEAVALAQKLVPDLIFMDIKMPLMDGLEATKRIKEKTEHTKVVVFSMRSEQQAAAIQSGADEFIEKGIGVQAIRDILSRFVP